MRNIFLCVVTLLCLAPAFGQPDRVTIHGAGDPRQQNPIPNCVFSKVYVDDTTGTVYTASGYPCAWAAPGADTRPTQVTSVEYITVPAGGSYTLSTSPVGPGTITHLHLTIGPGGGQQWQTNDNLNIQQNSLLRITCDGVTQTVDTGSLFVDLDNPTPFTTDTIANMLGNNSAQFASSVNRHMEINFNTGCTITYVNPSPYNLTYLFGEVTYRVGASTSRPSRQHWYASVYPATSVAAYGTVNLLPTITAPGGGELESETLLAISSNLNYVEADPFVYTDSNLAVTANGEEDFFGCGYACRNGIGGIHTDKWGVFYASGVQSAGASLQTPAAGSDMLFYRFYSVHDSDNIFFNNSLQVGTTNGQNGEAGNPGTNTFRGLATFWTKQPLASYSFALSSTGAGSGLFSGTNCVSGTYAAGLTTITCSASPVGTSTFTSFSGTGSASACSTSPCTFQLTANTTLTATFGAGGTAFPHINGCVSPVESGVATGTVACNASIAISAGNTVLCGVNTNSPNTKINSFSDGTNTYIQATQWQPGFGGWRAVFAIVGAAAAPSAIPTATFSNNSANNTMICEQWSGVHGIDTGAIATNGSGSSSTSLSAGPVPTAFPNELIWGYGLSYGGSTFTAGSGFTIMQNNAGNDSADEFQILSSTTGSISATMTNNQSDPWAMAIVGLY